MLSPSALFKGFAARSLASVPANQDSQAIDIASRMGRRGENYILSLVRKQHLLADEGSYFLANNNSQAGILSSAATGFVATTPALVVYNGATPGDVNATRTYIDWLSLVTTVVGSAASGLVNLQAALYIDTGNRYTSGGTALTFVNPNGDLSNAPNSKAWFGAITATAASGAVRCLDPLHIIRAAVSGTVLDVVGEQKIFNFGSVEGVMNGSITVANANNIPVAMPPVVLGPNQSALLYLWQNVGGTNVAATYAPNLGIWER